MPRICSYPPLPLHTEATPPTLCRYQPFFSMQEGVPCPGGHFLATMQACLSPWRYSNSTKREGQLWKLVP